MRAPAARPGGRKALTLWFHPTCAAYKRPDALLEALATTGVAVDARDALEATARKSFGHRRLPRIDGAESARHAARPSAGAVANRSARGTWRVRLVFFEEGRFARSGFVHLDCCTAYFETGDAADAILHFSPDLDDADREDLVRAMRPLAAEL